MGGRKVYPKKCPTCGKMFQPKGRHVVNCSMDCATASKMRLIDVQKAIEFHRTGLKESEICGLLGVEVQALHRRLMAVGYHMREEGIKLRKILKHVELPATLKAVPLTKNKYAIVDSCDYDGVAKLHWYYQDNGYAMTRITHEDQYKIQSMHRYILDVNDNRQVDRVDGNRLNNSRSNLRIATHSQNMYNSGRRLYNGSRSSKYKGVHWSKSANKWLAQIAANRQHHYLGLFVNEEDAARAYDKKAKELHGEFARINFG